MKLATLLTTLFSLLAFSAISQAQQDPIANSENLKKSEKVWLEMKKKCEGNYSYQKINIYMMGDRNVTTVTVKNNIVVERKYEKFKPRAEKSEVVYTETGDKIGTHKVGAPAKTIDELHVIAGERLREVLPENQVLSMYFAKNGLIKTCVSYDPRIADDVPTNGFSISNLKLEEKAKK